MDIHDCIRSCTKIETDQSLDDVQWSTVHKRENVNLLYKKKKLPYHLEVEKDLYDQSNRKNHKEKKYEDDDDEVNFSTLQFAEIIPSVREVGLGWNTFSILEKRFQDSQRRYAEVADKSSSNSNISYTTATSTSDDSYYTAVESIQNLKISSDDLKSEVSIDSSLDKSRYKKNALITGLLQSAESDFSDGEEVFVGYSANVCNTSHLINDIQNKQENQNKSEIKEKWNKDEEEQKMYEDRVFRLFQSTEDEDVYVHPLKEEIQKDPEWQEFRLSRKGIEHIQTARQYYLNLSDEKFDEFERVESKKSKSKK